MSKTPDDWWVKIGDFGISKREEDCIQSWSTLKGTSGFLAPELLGFCKNEATTAIDYKATDMWALGETTVLILTVRPTFDSPRALFDYCAAQGRLPISNMKSQCVTDEGCNFVEKLMKVHPRDRLKAEEGIQDNWFKSKDTRNSAFSVFSKQP